MIEAEIKGLDVLERSLSGIAKYYKQFARQNLLTLGPRIIFFCRQELRDVKYTGKLERSFVTTFDEARSQITVGPTAPHAIYVRTGTRPHWAPIAPLLRWARWKLGDEGAAYAVRWSIKKYGTSMYQYAKRGTKANPWPQRVINRGDFKVAIAATAQRLGKTLAVHIAEG